MVFKTILYKQEKNVGIITLNRPEVMNAINLELARELGEALDYIDSDANIRVLIITGGDKFFCSGADLKSVLGEIPVDFIKKIRRPIYAIEKLPKPVIAAIDGVAAGGGLELALACDLRIVSDTARLGVSEVNLGTTPGAGGTQKLARCVGVTKAKELLFLGKLIDGNEAHRLGLVNWVVPSGEVMSKARSLATELAGKSPLVLGLLKHLANMSVNVGIESGMDEEAQCVSFLAKSKDFKEGRQAFVEKRKPIFKGE